MGVHYWTGADAGFVTDVKSAYNGLADVVPTGTTLTVPNTGDTLADTTGTLSATWTDSGTGGTVSGTATAPAAAGVGACVTWLTGAVVNGRRLRGRTFIVPVSAGHYESNGTLAAGCLTLLNAWATAMVGVGGLVIWHRPSPGGSDGSSAPVTGYSIRDHVAVLRSRRD